MRILGDSNITDATVTATNVFTFADTDKLQNFQLSDRMRCNQGTTQIDLDFGSNAPSVSCITLCGTNISPSATVVLSYSNSDITAPENTITLPVFTDFNQIWFLDAAIERRFWRVDISDPDPQDSDGVEIGYLYIGEYKQLGTVDFPSTPTLSLISNPQQSATGQPYGSKTFNSESAEFSTTVSQAQLIDFLKIVKSNQNIDPAVLIPFEDALDNPLYPPRYGVLTPDSYSYPLDGVAGLYNINIAHSERF